MGNDNSTIISSKSNIDNQEYVRFSFYKNQTFPRDLLSESASFLWFQLFRNILFQLPNSDQTKKEYYHGNNEEFQSNIGSVISTNGFFFANRNDDFTLKPSIDIFLTLFIIEVDTRIDHVISSFNIEQEILFDISSAFQINEVYFNENKNIWIVEISLTNEYDKAAFHIRRKILPNNHPDLTIFYYNLSLIYFDQQEYEQSYVEIQKTLNIQRKLFPSNHPGLQQTLKLEKEVKLMLDYHKK